MRTANLIPLLTELENKFADRQQQEFPDNKEIYLNTGSCGKKPQSVLQAIRDGWETLNVNPTIFTFVSTDPLESARKAGSLLLDVPEQSLMLIANPTQGLHFLLSNLLHEGDEFVTTTKEHGSVTSISRWLAEQRGVITRRYDIDPFQGSAGLCKGILNLLSDRTKAVLISEIGSYNTWRPDLSTLQAALKDAGVELVVDGAHAPGQGECHPSKYRFWVGSGHKWLGGPNGTSFLTMPRELVAKFQPLLIGDEYFAKRDADINDITRFESQGTSDRVKWCGLTRACNLYMEIGASEIQAKQMALAQHFRREVEKLKPQFRTPDLFTERPQEVSSMVVCYWSQEQLKVPDIRQALWDQHQIWVQPDFANANPGTGIRVSCHWANNRSQIDRLLEGLSALLK